MKHDGIEGWSVRMASNHITRRRFLKTAATATGAAMVSPYLGGTQAFGAEAESKVVMGYGLSLVQLGRPATCSRMASASHPPRSTRSWVSGASPIRR